MSEGTQVAAAANQLETGHLECDEMGSDTPDGLHSMTTASERRLAVEHWLLSAADDPAMAPTQWNESGVALLRCGTLFGVVSISGALVRAAAKSLKLGEIDSYLFGALLGGPVFVDTVLDRYHVMVPRSAEAHPLWRKSAEEVEYKGRGHYLGVPKVEATRPGVRAYWCVPMDSMADLTSPEAVAQLVVVGRYELDRRLEASQ